MNIKKDKNTDTHTHTDPYSDYLIKDYTHWSVYLYQNQYYLGRVYIWSKRTGFVGLTDATLEEWQELKLIMSEISNALAILFAPDLLNHASLGNITAQCHMHVIPRYQSKRELGGYVFIDERWGKNYAPYNYDFAIPDVLLQDIKEMIKKSMSA